MTLTPTGLDIKTFDEVKASIESALISKFGTINLSDSSVFSQFSGIFAEREALLWQALEEVYNSFYPDTATGASLDGVCQLIGVTRLASTATIVDVMITGRNQVVITTGSEATALGINATFANIADVLITNENCLSINIDVTNTALLSYKVTINNIEYTVAGGTLDFIIDSLVTAINTSGQTFTAIKFNGKLEISTSDGNFIKVYVSSGLMIDIIATKGKFISTTKGAVELPINSLVNIQTPISGWIAITNEVAGLTGRNLETDNELRIRRAQSLRLAGAGTIDAIRARISNVEGVQQVTINENTTNTTVDLLPPHSFEALVLGDSATNENIGNAIWTTKPAGIQSYGDISVIVQDVVGNLQEVKFSRPTKLFIYVDIELVKTALYPSDGDTKIINGIVKQVNKLNVGETLVYQSLYDSVYSVAGITSAIIKIGGTITNVPPAVASINITATSRQIPVTDIAKIIITGV